MKHQLQTIRENADRIHSNLATDPAAEAERILTALSELERMAGEPVAWQRRMRPTWGSDTGYPWSPWEQCTKGQADDHWKTPLLHEWAYEARALYTAPPAQQPQYEAGDMASAHNDGFRAGVASVTVDQEPVAWAVYWGLPPTRQNSVHFDKESAQAVANQIKSATEVRPLYAAPAAQQAEAVPSSDLNPDEGDPVTLWAEIWRLREAIKGPDGYATWQDAATAERIRRVRAESKHAAPVAQQPQARPDFTDEWTGYLKDGETPFERFMGERKDLDALTKLYQRALEENERLKAQQPQAEAVPTIYVSRGQLENLKPDPEDEAGTYLPVRKTPKGKFTHPLFAAPQQAEAVPLFAALKVEGPRFRYAKVYGRIYQVLAVGSNKEDLLTVARLAKDAYYKQFPGTHEYKKPPFEWVVEEVPTAQPKFQPTEVVP